MGSVSPTEVSDLFSPIRYAKGVGEKKAILFKRLGVRTIFDLFWHFPLYYEDRSQIASILQTKPNKKYVIQGEILVISQRKIRPNLSIIKVGIRDRTGTIYAIWYNQDYIANLLKKREEIIISGKVEWNYNNQSLEKQIKVEDFELLTGKENFLSFKRIVPFYPLTEGLSQKVIRQIIKRNLEEKLSYLQDSLPEDIRRHYSFIPFQEAIYNIHFPEDFSRQKEAHRRFVFEEFFLLQCALALKRRKYKEKKGISFNTNGKLVKKFIHTLPFPLTSSQKSVAKEILDDMYSSRPMNRLLQGDVGSGKTIVATVALLTAIVNNYQGALMVPTEILAQQHWLNLKELLSPLNIQLALLVSEIPQKEKKKIVEDVKKGNISLLIGTHALIQEEVEFNRLGIVIIDEQHRFGVIQRLKLRHKGKYPDVLVMTATPIPRTLALTSYGDLDISVINELPPGRKPIITRWERENKRGLVYQFIKDKLEEGRQAYFVYPLIEESEGMNLKPAQEMAKNLQREVFTHYKVELLHGRMKKEEKEKIMHSFREKKIDILVSTTVIEVGIDIPNAVIMVIENAERFGLAQLHQLRGRVGRGGKQSYCFLLTGKNISSDAAQRMRIMCKTCNGFRIAEEDLKLRGPGEFFGIRQWGMLNLKIADLIKDREVLLLARKEAFKLIEEDSFLENHYELKKRIEGRFSLRLELSNVG